MFVRFPLQAVKNLFDQMRLVPPTGFHHKLTRRGTLIDQFLVPEPRQRSRAILTSSAMIADVTEMAARGTKAGIAL